jgi:DNA polymerase-3 subunit gamma/tau
MRELLDGVRYAPAQARFKVYIIDEVHMLSDKAFNALLKTLEEPPPHAKFIFATTEIRKVPVTILSRCQRFDLRRVEPEVIAASLARIAEAEGFAIEGEALALIARAAEGSVRDAQSLLDQALLQGGETIDAAAVRDMLGLADAAQTIELFERALRGEAGAALETWRSLHAFGADPVTTMLDLLEHCHAALVAKTLGPEATGLPKDQAARLTAIGAALSTGTLSRLWQLLMRAHGEVRAAPDPAAALEMSLIRLAYAADLPGPEEALKALRDEPSKDSASPSPPGPRGGGGSAAALAPAPAPRPPAPQSFEEVVRLIDQRRDIGLRLDVEKYVRLVSFRPGAIEFEPAPGCPAQLAHRLSARLKEWTGQSWLVAAQGGGGAETMFDRQQRELAAAHAEALTEPFVRRVLETFPGAEIVEVRQLAPPAEPNNEDEDA